MAKWIIEWDIGYGSESKIIEADTESAAGMMAYEEAREAFENTASYGAIPYSKEKAIELDLESEDA